MELNDPLNRYYWMVISRPASPARWNPPIMESNMTDSGSSWLTMGGRDWWPFTRLITTAAVLGIGAHVFLGWEVQPRRLITLPGQMLGVLSILAMISFVLADLYLLLFLSPLYVVGVLNDWFYNFSHWTFRTIFRVRSSRTLALLGLIGEVALFGASIYSLHRLITHL